VKRKILKIIGISLAVLVILYIIQVTAFPFFYSATDSMNPTLPKNSKYMTSTYYYKFFPVKRNDIIIYERVMGEETVEAVSRVIAVENDTVEANKIIKVNGQTILFPSCDTCSNDIKSTVPKGSIYIKEDGIASSGRLITNNKIIGKVFERVLGMK
jgi:signal peptidase I